MYFSFVAVTIIENPENTEIELNNLLVKLKFDKLLSIAISIDKLSPAVVQGLCGNADGNPYSKLNA